MKRESVISPFLYWPKGKGAAATYKSARKTICDAAGVMPVVVSDSLDIPLFFIENPSATLYYPIFTDSTGWWGELLGGESELAPRVVDKLIVSSDCQLMAVQNTISDHHAGRANCHSLFAAEISPSSMFFKKMNSGIAVVSDMLATDAGTILGLFAGKNQNKFVNILESTGNSYLGCVGWY